MRKQLSEIGSLLLVLIMLLPSSCCAFVATTRTATTTTRLTKNRFFSTLAAARSDCWRPTVNDVERISWGKPAKKKGTGSRGVPHRLNSEERKLFDMARRHGFLQVPGSAWRSQRREAPLMNTFRSLCDARAQPSIVLHKQSNGIDDVVVDLSPLRNPTLFQSVAEECLALHSDGEIVESLVSEHNTSDTDAVSAVAEDAADPWGTCPIYQLPSYCITWELPRSNAKALGKSLAKFLNTVEEGKAPSAQRKPVGVKPGKNRRHGGYGIG